MLHSGRWRDAEAMSMLRSRVGVAVMQNRLFAIGGYNGQERLNTVEVNNWMLDTFSVLCSCLGYWNQYGIF
jgi:kelch-like protein 18